MKRAENLKLIILLLLALCAGPGTARAEGARADAAKVRALITELGGKLAADPTVPGLSIAVLQKGGDAPVTAAFGTACLENATPMTPQSVFKIGSVTKVFTGALIHKLIEEGKLSYDTTIDRFFPGFPQAERITVRHLLEHTSGIMDMLRLPAVQANMAKYWTPAELIEMVRKQPLAFAPGSRQSYSNTGFLMLSVICEKLSGQKYAELVSAMFVDKLGMKSLRPGDDQSIVPRLSCGYASAEGKGLRLPMAASLAIAQGTGDLEAAPADVVRLVNLDRVLKNDVLDTVALAPLPVPGALEPFRAYKENAFGELDGCSVFVFNKPKITFVGKLGSFPGFGTVYFYDRQTRMALVISVNNERAISLAIPLGAEILHRLRGL